jgi:hypothetical protein
LQISGTSGAPGEAEGGRRDSQGDGTRFLDLVHALNERCLELMSRMSATDAVCDCALSSLTERHNPWRSLSPAARQQLARLPFSIVDIHFMDFEWWRRACVPVVRDGPMPAMPTCLRDASGAALTQETMMLAWHAVQLDRRAATWRIGMSRDVANVIWQLSTQDVLRISAQFPCEAHPRWSTCAHLWHEMIAAAESGDHDALQDAQREAMLRLSGQMTTTRGYGGG